MTQRGALNGPNDTVAAYGRSLGWNLRPRTVLVEGTTDVDLFRLAARLELEKTGIDLMGGELAVIAAGERARGDARCLSRTYLSPRLRTNIFIAKRVATLPVHRFVRQ